MDLIYKNNLSEENIEQVSTLISGLTRRQWNLIKSAVDYIYSEKAAKIKIDSSEEVEIMKSLLKL